MDDNRTAGGGAPLKSDSDSGPEVRDGPPAAVSPSAKSPPAKSPPAKAERPAPALMFVNESKSDVRTAALNGFEVVGFSSRSPSKETPNEDSAAVFVCGESLVLIVADGLGGCAAGELASRLAIDSLGEALSQYDGEDQLRSLILNGIESANERIQDLSVGAGTTLSAVEVTGCLARSYHVGDSLILNVGGRGKLKLQSVAHSPVGYAMEAGLLNEAEGLRHAERHVVSNVVGGREMWIEIGNPFPLARRDTLVLASDGLADNLLTDEIVQFARRRPLRNAAEELVQLAASRMQGGDASLPSKPDDLTLLLLRATQRHSVTAS